MEQDSDLRDEAVFWEIEELLENERGQDVADGFLRRQVAGTGAQIELYVVLMRGAVEKQDQFLEKVLNTAERIRLALGRPFHLGRHTCTVTPSIGITLFPDQGDDVYELLKQADIAMYQVKTSGRDGVRFFQMECQEP